MRTYSIPTIHLENDPPGNPFKGQTLGLGLKVGLWLEL